MQCPLLAQSGNVKCASTVSVSDPRRSSGSLNARRIQVLISADLTCKRLVLGASGFCGPAVIALSRGAGSPSPLIATITLEMDGQSPPEAAQCSSNSVARRSVDPPASRSQGSICPIREIRSAGTRGCRQEGPRHLMPPDRRCRCHATRSLFSSTRSWTPEPAT